MLTTIITFLAGPNGIFGVLLAVILGATVWVRRDARQDERNAQKAKEAVAHEKHIKDIADAGRARPSGGVHDDPHNRDNRP